MMTFPATAFKSAVQAAALAAIAGACASASAALPQFTFNPSAFTTAATPTITADNILVSDYSTVTFGNGGSTFSETGYLAISGFQLGGNTLAVSGLNSTYGMYIAFTGTGTTTTGDLTSMVTSGSFSSLSYTLYGYNGVGTFNVNPGSAPTESTTGSQTVLATGSLINGSVVTVPNGDGTFTPSANAKLSVSISDPAFFMSPSPFYTQSLTAFTNTESEVMPFAGGFSITKGGGSLNFVSSVPEPGTYGMLVAGLGVMAFVARRRKQ